MKDLHCCAKDFGFYAEYNEMPLEGFKEMGVRTSLHVRKSTCADWTGVSDLEMRRPGGKFSL